MTRNVGEILRDIVAAQGRPIIDDPRRLRAMLADLAAGRAGEVSLLLGAVEAQVPHRLLDPGSVPVPLVLGRLAQDLQARLFVTGPAAQWVVQTWAFALDLSPAAPSLPTPAPPETPPADPTEAPPVVQAAAGKPDAAPPPVTPASRTKAGQGLPRLIWSFKIRGSIDSMVAFSPDGDVVYTDGRKVSLCNVSSKREIKSFGFPGVHVIGLSPDGEMLAVGAYNDLKIWNVETGYVDAALKLEFSEHLCALAYSPDGTVLAAGGWNKKATLLHVPTQRRLADRKGKGTVNDLAFSPDGKVLAVGQKTLRLWDTAAERDVGILETGDREILSVAFSPDGALVATGGTSKAAELWNMADLRRIQVLEGHRKKVSSVRFSPDGTILATGSGDGTVRLWDVGAGLQVGQAFGERRFESAIYSVAFSGDGAMLAIGRYGVVEVWQLR